MNRKSIRLMSLAGLFLLLGSAMAFASEELAEGEGALMLPAEASSTAAASVPSLLPEQANPKATEVVPSELGYRADRRTPPERVEIPERPVLPQRPALPARPETPQRP